MGIYLNPGFNIFQKALNSEVFVDKTEMIAYLNTLVNTEQCYVSVSRPRRFGKTIAADMICGYYDRKAESREVFEERKLAACTPVSAGNGEIHWDEYLGKFDVIRLVMTDFMDETESVSAMLDYLTEEVTQPLSLCFC